LSGTFQYTIEDYNEKLTIIFKDGSLMLIFFPMDLY